MNNTPTTPSDVAAVQASFICCECDEVLVPAVKRKTVDCPFCGKRNVVPKRKYQ